MSSQKNNRLRALWIVPPVIVGVLFMIFMTGGKQPPAKSERGEPVRAVRIISISSMDLLPAAEGYGTVQPAKVWTAVAQVSGRIIDMHAKLRNGEIIPADTLLYRIDPVDYELTLAQAQAELEAKRQDRRHIRLTSPVQAQVRERLRDQGDLASAGEPILRLDVLSSLELEVYLPSSQIGSVTHGQKVDVFIHSDSHPVVGEVVRIVRSADNVTRRSKVRIALPDNDAFSPGQFARAHILLGRETTTTVPVSAIVERAGIEGVFVVKEDGAVRFRSIRTGKHWQNYREVLAGVEAGLPVVLDPPLRLRDGDRVKRATTDGN